METQRIVVGVDGSEGSRRALRWALEEAAKHGSVVEAVMVWQSPSGFGDTMGARLDESKIAQAARERLDETIAEVAADDFAVRIEPAVVEGDAALVLCRRAAEADLLVVGSLGHDPSSSVALGSVSTRCAQRSPRPIVIVPRNDEPLRQEGAGGST